MESIKNILAITGKPGLYKLVSRGNNMLIVESLVDGKRMPTYARDKIVALSDVSMFTDGDDVTLSEVLTSAGKKEGLKPVAMQERIAIFLSGYLLVIYCSYPLFFTNVSLKLNNSSIIFPSILFNNYSFTPITPKWRKAFMMPSSSTEVVTQSAAAFTSSVALPNATPIPA